MKHVKLILQASPEENGAAALAMILAYYGKSVAVSEMVDLGTANAGELLNTARTQGLYAQGCQMKWQELRKAPLPLIAHWRFHEFVVVTAIGSKHITIQSPSEGCITVSRGEFERQFTGVAICFAKTDYFTATDTGTRWNGLFRAFPAAGIQLAIAELFFCLCSIALVVSHRMFISTALVKTGEGTGMQSILMMGVAVLLQAVAIAVQYHLLRQCGESLCLRDTRVYLKQISDRPPSFFDKTSLYRLAMGSQGSTKVSTGFVRAAFFGLHLLSSGLCLAVLAVFDSFIAAAAVLPAAAFAVMILRQRTCFYSDEKVCSRDTFLLGQKAADDMERIDELRLAGRTRLEAEAWIGGCNKKGLRDTLPLCSRLWAGLATVSYAVAFSVGLWRLSAGAMSEDTLLACLYLLLMIVAYMGVLPAFLLERASARAAQEEYDAIFSKVTNEDKQHVWLGINPLTLTLQNVSFRYVDGKKVIHNVTLSVKRGSVVAVAGCKGSGKTTLARLFALIEQPSQGTLYLDSREAGEFAPEEIYANVALIGQGLPFPNGSLKENITAGCGPLSDSAVAEAASDALLHERILLHREGYGTTANALSQGEKILLQFAGVFARGAGFIISDEATLGLDRDIEAALIIAMRKRNIGCILLTEDPQLLQKADIVCRLEDGRITMKESIDFIDRKVYGLV